jgi:hypothetical protein
MPLDPADFVYGTGTLPVTKSPFRTLDAVPPGQKVTHDDANKWTKGVASAKAALTAGDFHGRAPQSSAPATDPNAVRSFSDASDNGKKVLRNGTVVQYTDSAGGHDPTARTSAASASSAAASVTTKVNNLSIINICDHGADPTNTTDSRAAIQEALDLAASTVDTLESRRAVLIPGGSFKLSGPIVLDRSTVQLYGESRFASSLNADGTWTGPVIHLQQDPGGTYGGPPLEDPLFSGWGPSWTLEATSLTPSTLYLDEISTLRLHGLTALTVEHAVRVDTAGEIIGSTGREDSDAATNDCLNLTTIQSGSNFYWIAYVRLDAGGTSAVAVSDPVFNFGQEYKVALCFDGSHFALYVDGVRQGGEYTAAGAIYQHPWERLQLGQKYQEFNGGGGALTSIDGAVGGVKFSNTRRYTGASYTPSTAKPTADNNTMLLLNFDVVDRGCVVGKGYDAFSGIINCFLPVVKNGVAGQTFNTVRDLQIACANRCTAVFGNKLLHPTIEDLYILSAADGVRLVNTGYSYRVNNIHIQAAISSYRSRQGFAISGGLCHVGKIWVYGGFEYQYVLTDTSGEFGSLFCQPTDGVRRILYGRNTPAEFAPGNVRFTSFAVDGEGSWTTFLGGVVLSGGRRWSFQNSDFEFSGTHTTPAPAFLFGNTDVVSFEDCTFTTDTDNAAVFQKLTTAPASPIYLRDCEQVEMVSTIPWAGTGVSVVSIEHGKISGLKGLSGSQTAAKNLNGHVDISGSSTSGTVTFATAEVDASYLVTSLVVLDLAGTPATKSAKAASLATGGFTINLDAAPGSSNSVRVFWSVQR